MLFLRKLFSSRTRSFPLGLSKTEPNPLHEDVLAEHIRLSEGGFTIQASEGEKEREAIEIPSPETGSGFHKACIDI